MTQNVLALTSIAFASLTLLASGAEKQLPLPGEIFSVKGHAAFLIPGESNTNGQAKPWVWYAPTLPNLPSEAEKWMFEEFVDAGISIAGIDVGESYGSPDGRTLYSALYQEMTESRGFSRKSVMLGAQPRRAADAVLGRGERRQSRGLRRHLSGV